MPRTLIDEGTLREVYHYRPAASPRAGRPGAAGDAAGRAGPLLRPAPRLLAGRAPRRRRAADVPRGVRRGLVQRPQPRHGALDRGGRPDRDPRGRPRTPAAGPCTWSAGRSGGIFALLAAADDPDLPIASITVARHAVRRAQVPLVAPLRPLLNLTDGRGAITRLYQARGRRAAAAGALGLPAVVVPEAGDQAARDRAATSTTPTTSPRSRRSTGSPRT